jgi:hopanoid-associated phosphorylase
MILAATGLNREARIVGGDGVRAIAGAGRSDRLELELERAAHEAEAVISMGLAGALAAELAVGDWIVADRVVWTGGGADVDAGWSEALLERLPQARSGTLLWSERMLLSASEKRCAHAETKALAVDMESGVAARVARRHRLPFAAVRVVSDAAQQDLPEAVRVGMGPDGQMAPGPVFAALLRDPAQLPALIRTARDAERAFRALAEGRRRLGPGLARELVTPS